MVKAVLDSLVCLGRRPFMTLPKSLRRAVCAAAAGLVGCWPASALAQQAPPPVVVAQAPAAQPVAGLPAGMPNAETLIVMLRTTLLALDHANQTGNYTVFRDMAAPGFQTSNTAAKLGDVFRQHREQRVDMSPVALVTPQLVAGPVFDQNGMLRMAGVFPMQPVQINFDIIYQQVDGRFRVFGITATPVVATAQPTAPPRAAPAAAKPPAVVPKK
jgi:hypothetical protein